MRYFPFKTLVLCVLLPPFVYAFSLQTLERLIQVRYDKELAATYTGDARFLFDGSVRLQDAIRKNIDAFLSSCQLIRWGVHVSVTVKTQDGIYLYPDAYDASRPGLTVSDSVAVARDNFKLLNDGLIRTVDVRIDYNTLLANAVLLLCVLVPIIVLYFFYQRSARQFKAEERDKQEALYEIEQSRQKDIKRLAELEEQRKQLSQKVDEIREALEAERHKASTTEDEMVDELLTLEKKIADYQTLQDDQLIEIGELKDKIEAFEKEKDDQSRQTLKGMESVRKRMAVLYKNVSIHERAMAGFMELTEELKIKAEETIHLLNDDAKQVHIKRKVFGKKNRETVFEVIFAYKGRLYFRNINNNRVEVLVIGTKLTQNKDLAFLDKL